MAQPQVSSPTNPQARSSLVQMPVEILIRITYHLPTPDLENVRLICKEIESKLFHHFSSEFFQKKQFMVSTASLQALIDISKHPALGQALKHVIIATDRPSTSFFSSGRIDDPAEEAAKRRNLQVAQGDARNLMCGGLCRDMLAEAFASLPNLQVVDLRDFNSPSRSRDGKGVPWRSYGSVDLARNTATPVTTQAHNVDDEYASSLFMNIMGALSIANARPRNIEVLLRNRNWSLFDWAFAIPPRLEQSFASVLSGLKTLHLSLSMRQDPLAIRKFISYANNVTWLRINFNYVRPEESDGLFSWLALKQGEDDPNYANTPFQVKGVSFDAVERFDIGNADMWPDTLLNVIKKLAPTLRIISLRRLSLKEKTRDPLAKINPWVPFLHSLIQVPDIKLRVFDFSQLQHITRDDWRGQVFFEDKSNPERNKVRDYKVDTRLAPLQTVVYKIRDLMAPDWPYVPPPVNNDDDDDDEDLESDDDDEEMDDGDA